MNYKSIFLLSSFLFLFVSCHLNSNYQGNNKNEKPVYNSNIVWKVDIDFYSGTPWVLEDNYLYQAEGVCHVMLDKKERYFYITKINLDTGEYIWKSSKIIYDKDIIEIIVKCRDYLFAFRRAEIFCFSAENGDFLATVQIPQDGENEYDKIINGVPVSYKDRYLFWQNRNCDNEKQIVRLDIEKIDFTKPAEEIQYITAESFGETGKTEYSISSNLLLEDDTIFFQSKGVGYYRAHPVVGAVDCETGNLKWRYEILNSCYGGGGVFTL